MISQKTAIQVYLYTSIAVLISALVFQMRMAEEGFQTIQLDYTYKCADTNARLNCRFIDVAGSTADTFLIRELTASTPSYPCGILTTTGITQDATATGIKLQWNSMKQTCELPAGSTPTTEQTNVLNTLKINLKDITCPKGDETYISNVNACTVVAGTVPRSCIKDGAKATDPEIKAAMACYANRYSDPDRYPSVTKLGSDTALLWNEFTNLGIYNIRNPCCDAAAAPTPAGSIKIGTLVVEKDWKFWTMVGLSVLIVIIGIAAVV